MVIWVIGLAGAGKSTLAEAIYERRKARHPATVLLDGDRFRRVMGEDLGHSLPEREVNAWRICRMCKLLDDEGIDVVCAILSVVPESRSWNREHFSRYFEVFVDVSMKTLIARDQKQLYSRALRGELEDVVGVDIDFPRPEEADYVFENEMPDADIAAVADEILAAAVLEAE